MATVSDVGNSRMTEKFVFLQQNSGTFPAKME